MFDNRFEDSPSTTMCSITSVNESAELEMWPSDLPDKLPSAFLNKSSCFVHSMC